MTKYKTGVIAGNFDIIHPGYIKMFSEMKSECEHVIILLQTDPTIERPEKLKPVLSVQERTEMLLSLRQIDQILTYTTESDLYELLVEVNPSVRFLGDDYKNRTDYTGYDLDIPIYFLDRSHGWSTTKFKQLISKTI